MGGRDHVKSKELWTPLRTCMVTVIAENYGIDYHQHGHITFLLFF